MDFRRRNYFFESWFIRSYTRNSFGREDEQDFVEEELFRISHSLCMQINPMACDDENEDLWGGLIRAGIRMGARAAMRGREDEQEELWVRPLIKAGARAMRGREDE